MSFPSGGPGYPQQGGGAQPGPQAPNTGGFPPAQQPAQGGGAPLNLGLVLTLAITGLGLVNYFMAFSAEARGADLIVYFLLGGGLLAALRLLPNGPKTLPYAAVLSVLGGLGVLAAVVQAEEVPGIITGILIVGIVQMLVAVAALLFEAGVIKAPEPKPQPAYGQPQQFGQPGQFGQQNQPGQFGQAQPPGQSDQGSFSQPTQYGPPVQPPGQQATTYAPQQGQFYQQQSPESGQQKPPGTPPGGFGKQS
ncbi:DUF5336 domain-containing protein [Amycolatopsis nigrescens]|uniref:DUF5336 domain-containing protein n=1 Tax=Amycolatopsis nigrescens TaxID=381445 RepID=UPI00039FC9D1|nr:DUF5336 domain-containing protein [Amycolatopsis nigrescens]